ncbi:MAG: FAD-dependent monooxygenase, partial [Gammaproteobacteria bacterium]|nr:FAD-dependent monooxygenase [Gammaproteobacteria bacterium]
MKTEHTDVVIAGGGLTGHTLALLLARGGITSTVVDSSESIQASSVSR